MRYDEPLAFRLGACLLGALVAISACGEEERRSSPTAAASPTATPEIPEEFYRGIPWERVEENGLRYMLTLPKDHDATRETPLLLALPPGGQDASMIQLAHSSYWHRGAERGWIVVSPEAPGGRLFVDGAEERIPALLDQLLARYTIEGERFHLAGVSNGGNSAFRIAGLHPARFCSLLALPGLPATEADFARLDRFSHIPVFLYVGFHDTRWSERMRRAYTRLDELGFEARIRILPGVGHALGDAVDPDHLFDRLDQQRARCGGGEAPPAEGAG